MKDALKLALKVLEDLPGFRADIDNAITAIKEALAQLEQEQCAAKMPCGTTVSNVYQAYEAGKRVALAQPEQQPSITKEARGTLILHLGWDDLPNGTKFYTLLPKQEHKNFCTRCGKRTNDIHTCTPPEGGHQ